MELTLNHQKLTTVLKFNKEETWELPNLELNLTGIRDMIHIDLLVCFNNYIGNCNITCFSTFCNTLCLAEEFDCVVSSNLVCNENSETIQYNPNNSVREVRLAAMLTPLNCEISDDAMEKAKRLDVCFNNYSKLVVDQETEQQDPRWFEIDSHKKALADICSKCEFINLFECCIYLHQAVINNTIRPNDFVSLMSSLNIYYDRIDLCEEGNMILDNYLWLIKELKQFNNEDIQKLRKTAIKRVEKQCYLKIHK